MSRTCALCGKGTIFGNSVSHAKNRTRRAWRPNLISMKTEIGGTKITVKVCSRCFKRGILQKAVG